MLLRRSKSGELKGKKAQALREQQELQRQRDAIGKVPPQLPRLYNGGPAPNLTHSSYGADLRPDSYAIVSGRADYTPRPSIDPAASVASVPIPPIPNGAWVDPYARTESMTHRGRYSYASSAISTINSPRRVRRRKDPTPFKYVLKLQLTPPVSRQKHSGLNFALASSSSVPEALARRLSSSFSRLLWPCPPRSEPRALSSRKR
jgi:hypothetical protein